LVALRGIPAIAADNSGAGYPGGAAGVHSGPVVHLGAENRGADPHLYLDNRDHADLHVSDHKRDADVPDDADNVDVTHNFEFADDQRINSDVDPAEHSRRDEHGSGDGSACDTCCANAVAGRSILRPGYTGVP
jgi:hypothetical protein